MSEEKQKNMNNSSIQETSCGELIIEKQKKETIINSLTDGVLMIDENQKIILINPQAENFLNIDGEYSLNKTLDEVSNFYGPQKLHSILGDKIDWTDKHYEMVLEEPLKRIFRVHTIPVKVKAQQSTELMIIIDNITREKNIERMKTEFVSLAAHQLRTPLSSVKWTLKMLLDGDVGKLTKDQKRFIEEGYQSNERMINLVGDLLSVAEIEEGRFLRNMTFQSMDKIIEESLVALYKVAKKNKVKLIFNHPKASLPSVKVDAEKIELVIRNIIDNAIRYNSKNGNVTISIKHDKINLEITISDTGIGIPKDQRGRLFNKFFRASNAVKSDTTGTGLGLFICKNIIKAHGGDILFESEEGRGSTFKIILPIAK
ncbi:MAG: ATP-binding protein [bacterium]